MRNFTKLSMTAALIVGWALAGTGCGMDRDEVDETETLTALSNAGAMSDQASPLVGDAEVNVEADRPAARLISNGRTLGVSLQGATATGSALVTAARIYKRATLGAATAVRSTPGTVQFLAVLRDSEASPTQRYTLDLPAGTSLRSTPDGGFFLVADADDSVVGRVDAPWAKDAANRSLPTSYTLEGNTLVQHTDVLGATFPVVVDPRISFGWYIYVRFNPTERREVYLAVAAAGGAAAGTAICWEAGPISVVCGAIGAVAAVVVFQYVYQHYGRPECGEEFRLRYSGGIDGTRLIRGDSSTSC